MNPARSLGPVLVRRSPRPLDLSDGALIGAAIGAVAYQLVRGAQPLPEAP